LITGLIFKNLIEMEPEFSSQNPYTFEFYKKYNFESVAELEQKLERYTCIPEDLLKPVLEQTSLRRLDEVKEKVSSIFQLIGLTKMLIHKRHSEALDSTEEKIKFWQNVFSFYKTCDHDEEIEESEEENDEKIE
jgi:hypothetical protein